MSNQALILQITNALPMKNFISFDFISSKEVSDFISNEIDLNSKMSVICHYTWNYLLNIKASPIPLELGVGCGIPSFNSFDDLIGCLTNKFKGLGVFLLAYVYKTIFVFEDAVKSSLINMLKMCHVDSNDDIEGEFLHFEIGTNKVEILKYLEIKYGIDFN